MGKRGMKPMQAAQISIEKGQKITNLKKQRIKVNLSQNELAAKSGVPAYKIQQYEQRFVSIDGAKLETICDLSIALGCQLEDILENKKIINKLKLIKK